MSAWRIEHRLYRLPFGQTVRTAHGPWVEREGVLVRAERVVGGRSVVGWGEVAPIPWFGSETVVEAEAALAGLEGRAENLGDALARVPDHCASTQAGLAAALGTSSEDMGEGERGAEAGSESVSPRAERVEFLPVAGLLPAGRAVLAAVGPRLELGFRVFKWKVGVLPAPDEWALLDDLLGLLPEGARLRLDANGAWDRRTAERWLERASERPIEYVEQPCFAEASRGAGEVRKVEDILRGLAADYPVKLALDESVNGAREVERWLAEGWGGVWILKPALLGAPCSILDKLAKAGADVVFGSALETAAGARSALRLAFAWADARGGGAASRRAVGFGVWPLFKDVRANAPWHGPFVRREDAERIDVATLWESSGEM
jgi:O-succinylbenzoate synthase